MAVVPLDQLWVDANFKETQLANMRIGQPVDIDSDLYGSDVIFKGRSRASASAPAARSRCCRRRTPPATGSRSCSACRCASCSTDPKQLDQHPLRIGLSTDVDVTLHDQGGPMLAQQSPTKPVFNTDIYNQQLAKADAEIAQIIHANMAQPANNP